MAGAPKKKASFGTTMGVTSIIAILVILVLVVFSALSIATSKADLKLSQKTSDGVIAFFAADSAAIDMMVEIYAIVEADSEWETTLENSGYIIETDENGDVSIGYTVPVDDFRNLNVKLNVDEDGNLGRSLWQVVPSQEWVPDESVNLYMPGM